MHWGKRQPEPEPMGHMERQRMARESYAKTLDSLLAQGRINSLQRDSMLSHGAQSPPRPMDPATRQDFLQRLAETVAWCRPRGAMDNPATSLRSGELEPRLLANRRDPNKYPELGNEDEREAEVRRIAALRAGLQAPAISSSQPFAGGRLIVYEPDNNLCDGASMAWSKGFLDLDNAPPWDTWVHYFRPRPDFPAGASNTGLLVAWVPPAFLTLVEEGIEVIPEACVRWAETEILQAFL